MDPIKGPAQPDARGPVKPPRPARRRYEPPRVTDYGSVGKLTQTGGATRRDKGNMKRVCL